MTPRLDFSTWTLELAKASAAVANYCDHAEHNEDVDPCWIADAGRVLRELACAIAAARNLDLMDLYAQRLGAIEARNPLRQAQAFDGPTALAQANSWHQLQLAQAEHDRHYHPDVFGLSRSAQLVHYMFHLAKLTGALAEVAEGAEAADFYERRLPDILLFGIKLATVTGEVLPERSLFSGEGTRQLAAL